MKNGVKIVQAGAYNGACTLYVRLLNEVQIHGLMCLGVIVFTVIIFQEVTLSYTLNPLFYLMYYE